jgi:hypothetical protein
MQQSGLFVVTNVIRSYGAFASVGITVLTLAEKGTRRLYSTIYCCDSQPGVSVPHGYEPGHLGVHEKN